MNYTTSFINTHWLIHNWTSKIYIPGPLWLHHFNLGTMVDKKG